MNANLVYADINASAVTAAYPYEPEIAMNVNNEGIAVFQPVCAYESGSDVIVTLFTKGFKVEKTFTIKNVVSSTGEQETFLADTYLTSCDMKRDILLTRNFFVKNNKWCIALLTEYQEDGKKSVYTIIDEDGTNLGQLPDLGYTSNLHIFLDNFYCGTPYLMTTYDYNYQLWTFTGTSSVNSVSVTDNFTKAYPNPLPAGETLTVELNRPSDANTVLVILDLNGRNIVRKPVNPNENRIHISSRFAHGHYIYNVIYGDGTVESGRLMAE